MFLKTSRSLICFSIFCALPLAAFGFQGAGKQPAAAQNDEDNHDYKTPLIQAYDRLIDESDLADEEDVDVDELRRILREGDKILSRIKQENEQALKAMNRQALVRPGLMPNVVLVIADDLDPAAVAQAGGETWSKLAGQGGVAANFLAGSPRDDDAFWCLMTGQHAGAIRRSPNGDPLLTDTKRTLTGVLWHAGYETGFFGAWPLTGRIGPQECFVDHFVGWRGGEEARQGRPESVWINDRQVPLQRGDAAGAGLLPWKLTTLQALAALERTGTGRPFCHVLRYAGLPISDAAVETLGTGAIPETAEERTRWASAALLGREVGRLLARLDEKNLAANTLVMVVGETSRAWYPGIQAPEEVQERLSQSSLETSLYVRWPGRVAPGTQLDALTGAWDVLPTLAEIGRDRRYVRNVHGRSLYRDLLGQAGETDRLAYWRVPVGSEGHVQAVQWQQWKGYVLPGSNDVQLYDLNADPQERQDVAAAHPDVVKRLVRK